MKCYPSIILVLLLSCLLSGAQGQVTLFPAHQARDVNPDTHLILTFDQTPTLEIQGCIRIYDTADDRRVDTLDMSIPPGPHNTRTLPPYDSLTYEKYPEYSKLITYRNRFDPPDPNAKPIDYQINYIGGSNDGDAYHFYPVIIRDNRAIICPHNHVLDYGKTYRVQIDPGVFSQVDESLEWTFSTKKTPPSIDSTTLEVSCDGSGDFSTVQGAVDFIPDHHPEPITLFIKNGTYDETVYFRNKSNVTILGESRDQVVICNSNNSIFNPPTLNVSRDDVPDGNHNRRSVFGVERSSRINIVNLTLRSLGEAPAQAEGLLVKGTEIIVDNVTIDGSGDALQATGTIYVHDSSITGYGDNVLGYGAVFFDHCDFVSTYGPHLWIRNPATNHGNALVNCTLRTIGDVETVVARNPITGGHGFPDCEAVLINCALEGIRPEGWGPVGGDTSNMRYWEYNSTDLDGHPVDMSQRHEIVRELTMEHDAEIIANYSDPTYVLGGWTPAMEPLILSQPQNISVDQGQSASFTVSVASVPAASYQWCKDGVPLAGATRETLTLNSVSPDDVGCYRVRVRNSSGQITSEGAQLILSSQAIEKKTNIETPITVTGPITGGNGKIFS